MTDPTWERLNASNHDAVRALIMSGLAEHWGEVDPSLNPDLDDMLHTYRDGATVVIRRGDLVVGTGTVTPRDGLAEIVRMSVAVSDRRTGLGRAIVDELVSIASDWPVEAVILETTSAWTDVVAFYRSCGFSVTHTEPSPFGEDTWFRLDLNPHDSQRLS